MTTVAAAATTKNAMVGSMSSARRGWRRLEVELARRIRRVRAARLRHVAVGQAGDVGTSAGATPDGVATGLAQAAAAPTPMMDNAGGDGGDGGNGGGMALASNVLASVLQGHGRRGGRPAGGVAPTASLVRAQGHVVGAALTAMARAGARARTIRSRATPRASLRRRTVGSVARRRRRAVIVTSRTRTARASRSTRR